MRTTVLTLIAIAAVSLAMTRPSVAQDSTVVDVPVSVLACDITENSIITTGDLGGVQSTPTGATVRIVFVNRSERTATNVTFLLQGRDGEWTIAHDGRFATGVRIEGTFGPLNDVDPNSTCDVLSATFDNGTVWQRG